jgi:hypothetical protein
MPFCRLFQIISQQNGGDELLSVSMLLFNYPKKHTKALDDVDCYVQIHFAKANIMFLYKHIDLMMVCCQKNIRNFLIHSMII